MLTGVLCDYGSKPVNVAGCVLTAHTSNGITIVTLTADHDLNGLSCKFLYKKYLDLTNTRLKMDEGSLGRYNGLEIGYYREKGTVHIIQSNYIDTIAKRFGMNNFTK